MTGDTYLLGTEPLELERLRLQHELWLPEARRARSARALGRGLNQLEVRRLDLSHDPLPREPFDLVWCRWVLMFLPEVEPLLDRLAASLSPGARLVIHEYIHWSSFGLHPHGEAVGRFGAAAMASLERAGWSVS